MRLIHAINRAADKTLTNLIQGSTASAATVQGACEPMTYTECRANPAICPGGHAKYRLHLLPDCSSCCMTHIGCC